MKKVADNINHGLGEAHVETVPQHDDSAYPNKHGTEGRAVTDE